MVERRRHYHLDGWPADLALQIENLNAGFYAFLVRLPLGFRQAAFAIMAVKFQSDVLGIPDNPNEHSAAKDLLDRLLEETASDIRTKSPRQLLIEAFGSCPDGFLGALSKIGPVAQPKQFYGRLHNLFTDFDKRQIANVARQFRRFDAVTLDILEALDPIFLVPRFAEQVASVQEALDLAEALSIIRQSCHLATDEALDASIRHHKGSITQWIERWLSASDRIEFPQHDLGSEYVPLDTAARMADAGRRYQNCLRSSAIIIRVLRGMTRFWENTRHNVIVEAQSVGHSLGWAYATIHMPRNGFPAFEVADEVEKHFLNAGYGSLHWEPQSPAWEALNRLTRHGTNLAEIEEIDEALEELARETAIAA